MIYWPPFWNKVYALQITRLDVSNVPTHICKRIRYVFEKLFNYKYNRNSERSGVT